MKNARVTAYTPDAIREAGEIIAAAEGDHRRAENIDPLLDHGDQLHLFMLVRQKMPHAARAMDRKGDGSISLFEFVSKHFASYVNTAIFFVKVGIEKAF